MQRAKWAGAKLFNAIIDSVRYVSGFGRDRSARVAAPHLGEGPTVAVGVS